MFEALTGRTMDARVGHMLRRFLADSSGATGSEYAIIGAMLSIAIVAGLSMLSQDVQNFFNSVAAIFTDWQNQ